MSVNNKLDIEGALNKNKLVNNDCWRWLGLISKKGYGEISINGNMYLVHRVSAFLYLDLDINDSKIQVCHKNICRFKDCWNPDHLYLGNNSTNQQDSVAAGTHGMSKKTHCKRGHPFDNDNTYISPKSSQRICRLCQYLKTKGYREIQKSQKPKKEKVWINI